MRGPLCSKAAGRSALLFFVYLLNKNRVFCGAGYRTQDLEQLSPTPELHPQT
jgi:hypothetical protein